MHNGWPEWIGVDKCRSCPNCTSPSSSMCKGQDPSDAPCWSNGTPWTPNSCRPRACHPCYTPGMCCSSIGTVSVMEYGSPLLRELNHEDNIGRSRRHLGKMATYHHFQDTYLVGCWIRLMCVDCQHDVQ